MENNNISNELTAEEKKFKQVDNSKKFYKFMAIKAMYCAIDCLICVALIAISVKWVDEFYIRTNGFEGSNVTLVVNACIFAVIVFAITVFVFVYNISDYKKTKKLFFQYSIQEECVKLKKTQRKITVSIFGVVFCSILIFSCVFAPTLYKKTQAYNQGKALIENAQFEEALPYFESIGDDEFLDTKALKKICKAYIEYKNEEYLSAFYDMIFVDYKYIHKGKLEQSIDSLHDRISSSYFDYKEKVFNERIASDVPYVGLPESKIGDTILGYAYKENDESDVQTIYGFYDSGKKIFEAVCRYDKVVEIHDYRDSAKNTHNSGKRYSYGADDDFDVDVFYDAEDFYDWYEDDFYDYYDAEDYYNGDR